MSPIRRSRPRINWEVVRRWEEPATKDAIICALEHEVAQIRANFQRLEKELEEAKSRLKHQSQPFGWLW